MQTEYEALMRELERYRKSDPLLFLRGLAVAGDVGHTDRRFIRAEALQGLAAKLHAATRLCDFPYEIVVRPEGIFTVISGVLLESSRSPLYLKASGQPGRLQGDIFAEILQRMNIPLATFVDVGANFGEISLAMARTYPHARIVAIEPSSDNLAVFDINRKVQHFPTQHIEVIRLAVTDKAELAAMPKGANTMNRVVPLGAADNTEQVACESLDTLFDRHAIHTADFVKIDIEGGEPKLKDALTALGHRVRVYYIEFSQFAPFDDYIALAASLLAQRFDCYDETATARLGSADDIARYLRATFAPGKMAVANLWFFALA